MDDQNKLNDVEASNFGNDMAAKEGSPGGYVANFNGDEINGKTYKVGDRIADDVDAGTLAYLTQNGRITPVADPADGPAGSDSGTPASGGGDQSSTSSTTREPIDPALSEDEQAEADKLVADNSKDALLALAKEEEVDGVAKDDNKAEIAARIIAGRRDDA